MAFLASTILSFLIVSGLFIFFGFQGWTSFGQDIVSLSQNGLYWLGIVIFSILFFIFFTFPIALMVLKNSPK
jgi:uncharacterized protein YjeT (DUF2065 family)